MKKTVIAVLAILMALTFMFVGCVKEPQTSEVPDNSATAPGESATAGDNTPDTPAASPTPKPAAPSKDYSPEYKYTLNEMTMPIWQSNTMYNECVTFHENEDGSITGNLLFKPIQIIAVRDVTLKIELKEGVHYKLDENDPSKVIWLPGDETFSIPYFKPGDLTSAHQDKCGTDGYGGILNGVMYCVGEWLYSKQISFTYTYDLNENEMPHAEFAGSKLPKTLAKLKGGEQVKIAFYGDSIFTGCDSSSTYGREPKAPTFFNMVKRQLSALYPDAKIKITNPSVGGWQAKNGLENVDSKVAAGKPDLVILGFGMNDSNVDGEDEAKTIQQMMDKILAKNPDCEFIVVSTFHANPQIGWDIKQGTHGAAFKALEKTGVAAMDMYAPHTYILERKSFQDTTGNNVNHPNDWFARMYAMQILTMLYDYNAG